MSIQFLTTSSKQSRSTQSLASSNIVAEHGESETGATETAVTENAAVPSATSSVAGHTPGEPLADSSELLVDELLESEYSFVSPFADAPKVAEPRSFEEAVERYHGKVFQLVYRYLGDYEEACDITQDTFVRAYSAWGEFRGDSQIYTWLYRIAINLCHNQQKKLQRRRRVERVSLDAPMDDESGGGRDVADERPLPLQVLESQELRLRLQQVLKELPENYRTVVILRDIEGLSYEEIARITDSTLEAIKSRLFRARGAIRRLMEPYLLAEAQKSAPKAHSSMAESLLGRVSKSATQRAQAQLAQPADAQMQRPDKAAPKLRRPRFRLL